MSPRRDESGFRHGLRVRMGAGGLKGQLLRCDRRHGSGHYWKVRLDTGTWVWPDGLIIDGPGSAVSICTQCGLPFMSPDDDVLCPRCDEETYGSVARAAEPDDDPVARRNWIRRHPSAGKA